MHQHSRPRSHGPRRGGACMLKHGLISWHMQPPSRKRMHIEYGWSGWCPGGTSSQDPRTPGPRTQDSGPGDSPTDLNTPSGLTVRWAPGPTRARPGKGRRRRKGGGLGRSGREGEGGGSRGGGEEGGEERGGKGAWFSLTGRTAASSARETARRGPWRSGRNSAAMMTSLLMATLRPAPKASRSCGSRTT
eukprot:6239390-Pyramimonas_sp.AAC.1